MLKIGFIQCDHVLPAHRGITMGDYDFIYQQMLHSASIRLGIEDKINVKVFAAVDDIIPESPSVCDAWVISSSQYDANSSTNWICALRKFVASIINMRLPLLGVCFGHQLIANVLGGKIERMSEWVVGYQQVKFTSNNAIGLKTATLLGIHRDHVKIPPQGALVIGSTPLVQVASFFVPPYTLGMQYHMEFTASYVKALLESRRPIFTDENYRSALNNFQHCSRLGIEATSDKILRFLASKIYDLPVV